MCGHGEGDWISDMGFWLCSLCWCKLDERPKRYAMVSSGVFESGPKVPQKQMISWTASQACFDGTTLDKFIQAMALRFNKKCGLPKDDSYSVAISVMRNMPCKYGDKDYDWTISSAIDMADEEMSYWDESGSGSNS